MDIIMEVLSELEHISITKEALEVTTALRNNLYLIYLFHSGIHLVWIC